MLYFVVYLDSKFHIHTELTRDLPFEFEQNNPKKVYKIIDVFDAKFPDPRLQRAFERLLMLGGHFDADFKPGDLAAGLVGHGFGVGLSQP